MVYFMFQRVNSPFSFSILGLMNNYSEPGKYPFFLPWFMLAVNNLFSIPWFIMTLSGHRGLPHFDTRSSVKHGTLEDLSKLSEILLGFTTNHRYFLCYWLVDESNIILGFPNTHGFVFSTCITKISWIWEALVATRISRHWTLHFAGQLPDRGNRGHLRGGPAWEVWRSLTRCRSMWNQDIFWHLHHISRFSDFSVSFRFATDERWDFFFWEQRQVSGTPGTEPGGAIPLEHQCHHRWGGWDGTLPQSWNYYLIGFS